MINTSKKLVTSENQSSKNVKQCNECQTELEITLEYGVYGMKYPSIQVWFCPTCKAGCGEVG